jgi:MFS family permease
LMVRFACLYNALIYLGAGCFSVYYMVAYHDVGLSVLLISIVNVVFDVSESASELPTSVLFDRWSRERTLIIGVLCRVAGFILMLFWSANFAVLCLANVLAGIGAAVESGAASSLYIEYARKHDPSLGMKTLVSRLSAMIGVCTICGGAVGAVLFLLDSQLIWLGATVFYVLAIIPLLGLMRAGSRTKAAATDGSGTTEPRRPSNPMDPPSRASPGPR